MQRRGPMWWCLIFLTAQVAGYVLPQFANIHCCPGPLFVGVILLLPGSLLVSALPESTSSFVSCIIVSGINALTWYLFWRLFRRASAGAPEAASKT